MLIPAKVFTHKTWKDICLFPSLSFVKTRYWIVVNLIFEHLYDHSLWETKRKKRGREAIKELRKTKLKKGIGASK